MTSHATPESNPDVPSLAGRRIVVTGANRGLGAALARAFVAAGARVLVHARGPASAAEAMTASGAHGWVAGDLRDETLAPRLAAAARHLLAPGVDVLVLNAGIIGTMGKLEHIDFDELRTVMEVNVDAQLRQFVACLPQLLAAGGKVLWLGSGVGRFGVPGYGAYTLSKHAVEGLNRQAHADYGEQGLVSVSVAPGMVQTDMLRAAQGSDDVSAFTPPEVAAASFVRLVHALSERGAELAGQSLDVTDF